MAKYILVLIAFGAGITVWQFFPTWSLLPAFTPLSTESLEQAEEPQSQEEVERPERQLPEEWRAVYLTSWAAGRRSIEEQILLLGKEVGVNAVVVDLKDFSGLVSYDTDVLEVAAIGAETNRIPDLAGFASRLQEAGIFVIGRITVFQDPVLAAARPDLALQRVGEAGEPWLDNNGIGWLDPAAQEVWEYNVKLAADALAKGVDEINFDYVRFPSDGDLADIAYPVWEEDIPRREIIRGFFAFLRENLPEAVLSVDLFGLVALDTWDDMGVGQVLEDAFPYFDYVSPMVYPSHYAAGFAGFENPDAHPYEVVRISLEKAKERLIASGETGVRLRPWLQYFTLRRSDAEYDSSKFRSQIEATKDALGEQYAGFALWNPESRYPLEEMKEIFLNLAPLQDV
ncbi:putative glycoside hydrolase [Patescibacteria group bacterium]|nr:putative glycoside hydrolase [Patescibacteria group bacterium]